MPGPLSTPWARTKSGQIVAGKTRLKSAGLKSRANMTKDDWPKTVVVKGVSTKEEVEK